MNPKLKCEEFVKLLANSFPSSSHPQQIAFLHCLFIIRGVKAFDDKFHAQVIVPPPGFRVKVAQIVE